MTTTTQLTRYEVLWGIEYGERATWIDYGDGMAYSLDAEANATRAFLEAVKAGRKVELAVNGVHRDGYDFAAEWAELDRRYEAEREVWAAEDAAAAALVHKTVTHAIGEYRMNWRYARMQVTGDSLAVCTCGWKRHSDTREGARFLARHHRENPA